MENQVTLDLHLHFKSAYFSIRFNLNKNNLAQKCLRIHTIDNHNDDGKVEQSS